MEMPATMPRSERLGIQLERTNTQSYGDWAAATILPSDISRFCASSPGSKFDDKENRDPALEYHGNTSAVSDTKAPSPLHQTPGKITRTFNNLETLVPLVDLPESTLDMVSSTVAAARSGRLVVVKRISKGSPRTSQATICGMTYKERDIYALLSISATHVHILKAYGVREDSGHYYIIRPFMPCSLLEVFNRDMKLPYMDAESAAVTKMWAAQMTSAIIFLHANGIIHTNLQPSNILIDWEGRIQLYDYVCAYVNGDGTPLRSGVVYCNRYRGSEMYASPEMRDLKYAPISLGGSSQCCGDGAPGMVPGFGLEADAWALGCVLAELFRRPQLDRAQAPEELQTSSHEVLFSDLQVYSDFMYDGPDCQRNQLKRYGIREKRRLSLVLDLLHPDPQERLAVSAIPEHAYFTQVQREPPPGRRVFDATAAQMFAHHNKRERADKGDDRLPRWTFDDVELKQKYRRKSPRSQGKRIRLNGLAVIEEDVEKRGDGVLWNNLQGPFGRDQSWEEVNLLLALGIGED